MRLSITYPTRPARPSTHTSLIADLFGLSPDPAPHTICTDLDLPLQPGTITAFTGPSGSGKSTLLRAAITELERRFVIRHSDSVIQPHPCVVAGSPDIPL